MDVLLTLIKIFCSGAALAVFLAAYLTAAFADLFKRHLLSNEAVYYLTVFLAPAAAFSAVGTPVYALLYRESSLKTVFAFIGGAALLLTAAAVYIRGHVSPIDKTLPKYEGSAAVYAAQRLIAVGMAGTLIYGAATVFSVCKVLEALGQAMSSLGSSGQEILIALFIITLLLLVPVYNVLVIIAFIVELSEYLIAGAAGIFAIIAFAVMTLLANFLLLNGCIRYILTTDKTKGKKALFIILSIIPAFNAAYGFICLSNISKRLKNSDY